MSAAVDCRRATVSAIDPSANSGRFDPLIKKTCRRSASRLAQRYRLCENIVWNPTAKQRALSTDP